mmetsp:Transcript_3196/g.4603  ORF Transcript_3196/g.4603 Transcript_3196/m.4603 type:complete len:455 (+) Transcript_3196:24-1388(+)
MSDYEYSDDDFQYSDNEDEEQDDGAIQIQNRFYEAEDVKRSDLPRALQLFESVVADLRDNTNADQIQLRFKSLEHIVGLHFSLGNSDQMISKYEELLSCLDSVTRNECNDSINNILDTISVGTSSSAAVSLAKMYEITLDMLKKQKNERLWFNTSLKLAKMYLQARDYCRLESVIDSLHQSLRTGASVEDPNKEAYLLEVYALEIAMYSESGEKAKLKEIYPKTRSLSAAIQDPRIMGGIFEAGGKVKMDEGCWSDAYDEFFDAFRNYQEAGNPRAKQCLKYVVLANMIALKNINPFDSREAKVYKDDPEIQAMMQLRQAFETSDVREFERLLHNKSLGITADPFINRYISSLLRNIRSQVLIKIVRPYRRVKLDFLAKEVNIDVEEIESILVQLILDERIDARIDQKNAILEKKMDAMKCVGGEDANSSDVAAAHSKLTYTALEGWAKQLDSL